MVARLNAVHVPLEAETVFALANCKSPGRPHVARALVKAGLVSNLDEAFERFLKKNRPAWVQKVADIDLWYARQFARFLEKLHATKEVDGKSLLQNSMIVYGSGNADGNAHTHANLPVILAGKAGGAFATGRHVKFKSQPMSNLYLNMLDRMGVDGVARHGDSTGRVEGI